MLCVTCPDMGMEGSKKGKIRSIKWRKGLSQVCTAGSPKKPVFNRSLCGLSRSAHHIKARMPLQLNGNTR